MFKSLVSINVLVEFCLDIVDHTTVDIYTCNDLDKPIEILPQFLETMKCDDFFEDASCIEIKI